MSARTPVTEEDRARKRAEDREYAIRAVEALRSSEGWQRWLATRAVFHTYSFGNQLLIASQRPTATRVAGFSAWLGLGYSVKKGETAIRIWAPCPPSKKTLKAWRDAGADPEKKPRTFFRLSAVFADDQVQELPPPAEPAPLHCPVRELDGEDLAPTLPALTLLAGEIGSGVSFKTIAGGARGFYEPSTKRIAVEVDMAVNQQAATLVHELAHALVRADRQAGDPQLDYATEELVAESVAFTVVRSLGIDADARSIPYLASWAEASDITAIEKVAALIDRLARRIETSLDTLEHDNNPSEAPEVGERVVA
jgi:antirestriction protein ArdC